MRPLHALAPHSEIVVSTGTPKHDRCLSDKILAAFGHAYAEGALGVAAVLRRALEATQRSAWTSAPPARRSAPPTTGPRTAALAIKKSLPVRAHPCLERIKFNSNSKSNYVNSYSK